MRKDALFNHFGKLFSGVVDDVSADEIVAALWQRERMQNTSVGDGLALPHATISTEGKTRLGVITLESPIKYQAPDGGDVDILFVTLGSPRDRQKHLLLLSSVAKLVMGTPLLERLRAADSTEEILQAIEKCSRELQE